MQTMTIGLVGASGYSGVELTKLLAAHRHAALRFVTSERWVGHPVEQHVDVAGAVGALRYVSLEQGLAEAPKCDVVLLATPAETSLELAPKLLGMGVRVIDLAGSFRLRDAAQYPVFYGFAHGQPALLADAVYGLPELFRDQVKGARFVANPGCYATAAALSVAPLLEAGLVEPDSVVITGASGVSGAGRKASEDLTFMEVDADYRAYRTLKHQHTPEIDQTLSAIARTPVQVVFTPHLLPIKRGILCTTVAKLKRGVGSSQVTAAFADKFGGEALVSLLAGPDSVRVANVVNTPRCLLGAAADGRHVVTISAIDNLLKGAASQAIQNLNLALGLPETEGLSCP